MPTHVIGTAGHVDHGKSSLVTALTGINPDRLKEEQAREMTIELGFAWCILPSGEEVGIVDVPGHRDFIENMLAGIGGIDAVLFVIAADEGVMPQTREHLAILDMLQVGNGVIVLTKVDLVPDADWLTLVEEDIRKVVQGTVLAESQILRVSSKTGEGIPQLMDVIVEVLNNCPPRMDTGQPRLPVDRVFSMPGFGTIVTGTLSNGSFKTGDEVEILPAGLHTRIRGLQNHKHKVDAVIPGQRVAINLTGVAVEDIKRGDVITRPGLYPPSRRVDVKFDLLKDASASLKHRSEVKLFIDAAEIQGSVRLLGMEELLPGKEAFLQIELETPIVAQKGDRFILRRPSPGETLGGGTIIEVNSSRRYKRFSTQTIALLETKFSGSTAERLLSIIQSEAPMLVSDLLKRVLMDTQSAMQEIRALQNEGALLVIEVADNEKQNYLITHHYLEQLSMAVRQTLERFHAANPLKSGIPREELRSRLKLQPRIYAYLMDELSRAGVVEGSPMMIWLAGFRITLSARQQSQVDKLLAMFSANRFTPPSVKECIEVTGEDLYRVLLERSDLLQLNEDVVFDRATYEKMKAGVILHLQEKSTITVADFRDKYQTSRKYALAFLEHLDKVNITRRDGDFRRLTKPGQV